MNLDELTTKINQYLENGNNVEIRNTSIIEVWLNGEFEGSYFINRRDLYFALKGKEVTWN